MVVKSKNSDGFALPTILVASMIMLIVLLASVVSTAAVRVSLAAQYYNQIAQGASDAGIAYAKACLSVTNGVAKWGGGTAYQAGGPLMPGTDCTGAMISGLTCNTAPNSSGCLVLSGSDIKSSFTVGTPTNGADGKVQSFSSVGKVNLIRTSDGSTWRAYTRSTASRTNFAGIVTSGLVMNLDAGNTASYSGSGTTWTDLTGSGHNGTLASGVGYSSANGGAITFDGGSTHYVNVGFLGKFFDQGTIDFWMKANVLENWRNPFTTNFNGGTATNAGIRYEETSAGAFAVAVGNDAGTAGTGVYLASGLQVGTWYHVVLIWDKVNNNITGYLNTNSFASPKFDHQAQTYWATALPNVIVGEGYDTTRTWSGSISAVHIYNRALSPGEVQQNYSALAGRYFTSAY